ncbi:hypothetical protein LCGC14_1742230 [marine sediment metagenome]|uniref:Uncharacterized protein n=1 Tax=marine sediment metagenome TaxID=412755 RepID=A0A0F9H6D1_9ZZZZ
MERKNELKCEHPLCWGIIKEGEKYIDENNETWHLICLDRLINSLQEDPTRPHEVERIQEEYWKNRDKMIKVR